MTENVYDSARWATVAAELELLAFSFAYPTQRLEESVRTGEWVEAARECARALGADVEGPLAELAAEHNAAGRLKAEATRLFVGSPLPKVHPYEGVALSDDPANAMLFVSRHAVSVRRFMASCGIVRGGSSNDSLDHAAAELEFMYRLALAASGDGEGAGLVADADLPGGSAAAAYGMFADEHARAWLPEFADAVAAETREPFYLAAASLLAAFFA